MKSLVRWAVALALHGGGDDSDARAHLGRADPLMRRRARRALQHEVEAACIADPRLAAGRPILVAVAERMGVRPALGRVPFWWPSVVAVIVVIGIVAITTVLIATRTPADKAASRFAKLPEVADAYENGGRPLSLGPLGEELFGERFAEFVIAADRHARKRTSITELDLDRAQRKLTADNFRAAVGDEVAAAIVALANAARAAIDNNESIWRDAGELNTALSRAGLGYYVDDSHVRHNRGSSPMLYTHIVERVRVYDVGEGAERVLWLRRLDNLNRRKTLVGSTHEGSDVAVIRRNLVDEVVNEDLMPVLKDEASFGKWQVPPSKPRPFEKDLLESRAGIKIREDFARGGVGAVDGARVANLLAARDDLVADIGSRAAQRGHRLSLPTGYLFGVGHFRKLEPVIGTELIPQITELNKRLARDENRAVYSRARALYVESVELHEVQHRLDQRRGSSVVDALRGHYRSSPEGEPRSRYDRRLTTEYSAYLASIANSKIPFVTLALLSGWVFDEQAWRSTYSNVAAAVIESIASHASIEHGAFVYPRGFDRIELARAVIQIYELSAADLSAHAAAAWEQGFAEPLVRPALRSRSRSVESD